MHRISQKKKQLTIKVTSYLNVISILYHWQLSAYMLLNLSLIAIKHLNTIFSSQLH